ncbi:MAG TPA: OsmC family protein [Bdellovibrionales bacterium]|nr:OsmC family protein [Bdellovibrionales bacterium]
MNSGRPIQVKLNWLGANDGILHADGKPCVDVEPPKEFGGQGKAWNPGELLLGALAACFMQNFLDLASARKLKIESYDSVADGTLIQSENGVIWRGLAVEIKLDVPDEDAEAVAELLEKARERCAIGNMIWPSFRIKGIINSKPAAVSMVGS